MSTTKDKELLSLMHDTSHNIAIIDMYMDKLMSKVDWISPHFLVENKMMKPNQIIANVKQQLSDLTTRLDTYYTYMKNTENKCACGACSECDNSCITTDMQDGEG